MAETVENTAVSISGSQFLREISKLRLAEEELIIYQNQYLYCEEHLKKQMKGYRNRASSAVLSAQVAVRNKVLRGMRGEDPPEVNPPLRLPGSYGVATPYSRFEEVLKSLTTDPNAPLPSLESDTSISGGRSQFSHTPARRQTTALAEELDCILVRSTISPQSDLIQPAIATQPKSYAPLASTEKPEIFIPAQHHPQHAHHQHVYHQHGNPQYAHHQHASEVEEVPARDIGMPSDLQYHKRRRESDLTLESVAGPSKVPRKENHVNTLYYSRFNV
ncbi:hypothetical protein GL218_09195 [Daldinia childiae]|uniref:uncharacterized protein n=1 Tax=Daldinia childiae TaxID=326645 RepID=UPI001447AFA7|nr:uncharacterized protein GL218_09195 [Daldinia childiae]KAF3066408.1 hypothetical protein GL218_09195 [Daldinia childiae]